MYDLHNFKLKFNITHVHNFRKGRKSSMKHWDKYTVKFKGHTVQVNPNCIIIWSKGRNKTEDPVMTSDEIIRKITYIAIEFCKKNNIRISEIPIPIGKEVKVLDYRIDGNFFTPNIKAVYPKPSHIEFTHPTRADRDALKFVSNIEDWKNLQQEQVQINQKFSKNIELHIQTMRNIDKSLASIEKIATRPSLLQRLKRWFK